MKEENLDELISKSEPGQAVNEIYIYPSNSLPGISMTASFMIDALKDWNKKLEKHGSKEIHPSYMMTLDKIPSALGIYTNLGVQGKSEEAISEALKHILDLKSRGRNRIAYIYPFLFKDNNRIAVRFPIFIANKEVRTDARPFRNSCFNNSLEMIQLLLKNRAEKSKIAQEDNPGELLLHKNKAGHEWLFPKVISLESEIHTFLKKGFLPYTYIPQSDFLQDFIQLAREQGAVTEILPDYHIIVDKLKLNPDGTFSSPPELVYHYRTQADALEKFAMIYLSKFAEEKKYQLFSQKLIQYTEEHITNAPKGQKQNRDKITKLISLIEEYPFDASSSDLEKRAKEILDVSIRIVKKTMEEFEKITSRKHDDLFEKYIANVPERISRNTKSNLTLLEINLREELIRAGIHENNLDESIQEAKKRIGEKFSFHELNESDTILAVDHGYMAAVLHKLSCSSPGDLVGRRQYAIAKRINARISNPKHPELNSKLMPDQIARLHEDIRNTERMNQLKYKEQELRKKFNTSAGLAAALATILIFLVFSIHLGTLTPVYIGLGMGAITGFIAGRFFRSKPADEPYTGRNTDKEEMETSDLSTTPGKEDKLTKIAKAAENIIFPKRFNKISEKILDNKSLKKAIYNNIEIIRSSNESLLKETDNDKVASTIEYALMQNVVTITVPDELVPKNKPNGILIHKDDLKASMIREQIADHYRSEAEKSVYDRLLVKYYTFLINTIEMEYYKYLPGKKR